MATVPRARPRPATSYPHPPRPASRGRPPGGDGARGLRGRRPRPVGLRPEWRGRGGAAGPRGAEVEAAAARRFPEPQPPGTFRSHCSRWGPSSSSRRKGNFPASNFCCVNAWPREAARGRPCAPRPRRPVRPPPAQRSRTRTRPHRVCQESELREVGPAGPWGSLSSLKLDDGRFRFPFYNGLNRVQGPTDAVESGSADKTRR